MNKQTMNKCQICGEPHHNKKFCSDKCKFLWQQKDKPTREWLYQKYVIEGLDCPEIAAFVNRDNKRVWEWLRNYGIQTRPRGHGNGSKRTQKQKGNNEWTGRKHTAEACEKIRQARIREGSVPYLKDGKPWMKGRKGPLSTNWKGGLTPDRQKVMTTPGWKKAVKTVWKRDKATCQRCNVPLSELRKTNQKAKLHLHHILSFSDDTSLKTRCNPNNLVLLCSPCHKWIHSRKNHKHLFIHKIAPIQGTLFSPANLRAAEKSASQESLF